MQDTLSATKYFNCVNLKVLHCSQPSLENNFHLWDVAIPHHKIETHSYIQNIEITETLQTNVLMHKYMSQLRSVWQYPRSHINTFACYRTLVVYCKKTILTKKGLFCSCIDRIFLGRSCIHWQQTTNSISTSIDPFSKIKGAVFAMQIDWRHTTPMCSTTLTMVLFGRNWGIKHLGEWYVPGHV